MRDAGCFFKLTEKIPVVFAMAVKRNHIRLLLIDHRSDIIDIKNTFNVSGKKRPVKELGINSGLGSRDEKVEIMESTGINKDSIPLIQYIFMLICLVEKRAFGHHSEFKFFVPVPENIPVELLHGFREVNTVV